MLQKANSSVTKGTDMKESGKMDWSMVQVLKGIYWMSF